MAFWVYMLHCMVAVFMLVRLTIWIDGSLNTIVAHWAAIPPNTCQ